SALPYTPNHFAGKHALMIHFFELRMPDGKTAPIDGYVAGGVDNWKLISVLPNKAECCLSGGSNPESLAMTGLPAKGYVNGGWRGLPEDELTQTQKDRMFISREGTPLIPAGVPMMMKLNTTTTVAINSPRTKGAENGTTLAGRIMTSM